MPELPNKKLLIFIFIIHLCSLGINGQSNNLEDINFIQKGTYDAYSTNYVFCPENNFTDSSGKLWFSTCFISNYVGSGLLSLDGKSYTSPKLKTTKFNIHKKNYIGILEDRIFGYTSVKNNIYLYYYDINTNAIKVYDTLEISYKPGKQASNNTKPVKKFSVQQNIFESNLYTYIRINNSVKLIKYNADLEKKDYHEVALPQHEIDLTYHEIDFFETHQNLQNYHKEWYFVFKWHTAELIKINLITGETRSISTNLKLTEYVKDEYKVKIYPGFLVLDFMHKSKGETAIIYSHDNKGNINLKKTIHSYEQKVIFQSNKKGQFITHFYSPDDNAYFLYITDTDGKVYDASNIIKDFISADIKKIYAEDFTKRLHILTGRGFYIYEHKDTEIISQLIETDGPVRGIEQFDDYVIYLKETGPNEEKKYNLKTQQHEANPMCEFNHLKLKKADKKIWGIVAGDLAYYDLQTKTCEIIALEQDAFLFALAPGNDKIVFSDHESKFWLYNVIDRQVEPILYKDSILTLGNDYRNFLLEHKGVLWITTLSGLYKYDFAHKKLVHINKVIPGFNFSFISISQGKEDELWLGSHRSGVVILNTKSLTFKVIQKKNGLANNTVASITKDLNQLYWVATYNGISILNADGNVLDNLSIEDGIINREANRHAAKLFDNGHIAIGTIDGISLIDPDVFLSNYNKKDDFKIFFTKISYRKNKSDSIASILNGFNTLDHITLSPKNKQLYLEFASSNYIAPDKISFAYKIDEFQEKWVELGKSREHNLFNLPSGDYKLKIKATNERGKPGLNTLALSMTVEGFFYEQTWFYLLVIFVICIFSLGTIFILRDRIRLATAQIATDNKKLKQLTQKLEDLNRAKNEFFTTITHEFRTPLTVIKGITQYLKQSSGKKYTKEINELEHSTEDLLDMVNQVLDLRKLSSNKLKLDLKQSDLVLHLKYMVDNLQFPALQKGVKLTVESDADKIIMDLDTNKLRSVINNIITNALKHTPKDGEITVNLSLLQQSSIAKIEITDTGEGISNAELQQVFELFYQTENKLFTKENGSGIGLYYAKELIDLMKGKIDLKSKEGEGTTVSIELPITNTAEIHEEHFGPASIHQEGGTAGECADKQKLHKILIIEDSPSVRSLLEMQLNDYELVFAHDGDNGLKKAFEVVPDLIISDIMMPGKDGYEVCEILKTDIRTSHIPVILLTARVDNPSKLKGLKAEADVYIKKPYDYDELKLHINNLIKNRLHLQKIYQNFDKYSVSTEHPKEDEFILKLRQVVLNNIDKEEFSIKDICELLKLSRTGLHGKVKALTGLSASNYINKIRMQQAKFLIESEDLNISEIAYKVGITNLSYFSRLFRKEFGMSPTAYKEHLV